MAAAVHHACMNIYIEVGGISQRVALPAPDVEDRQNWGKNRDFRPISGFRIDDFWSVKCGVRLYHLAAAFVYDGRRTTKYHASVNLVYDRKPGRRFHQLTGRPKST